MAIWFIFFEVQILFQNTPSLAEKPRMVSSQLIRKNKFPRKVCQALSNLASFCSPGLTSPSCHPHFIHPWLLTGPSHTSQSCQRTGSLHWVSFYLLFTCRIVSSFRIVQKGPFLWRPPNSTQLPRSSWCWIFLSLYSPYHNVSSPLVCVSVSPTSQSALPGQSMPSSSSCFCQHHPPPFQMELLNE